MGVWTTSLFLLACLFMVSSVCADTPANCTFYEVTGKWTFYESARNQNKHENCTDMGQVRRKIRVDLQYPNIAVDEFGNFGTWTMVYNEGFEVTVNERTYFAFSMYTQDGANVTSICDRTLPGWSHDVTLRQWACFYGKKQRHVPAKVHTHPFHDVLLEGLATSSPLIEDVENIVREVNSRTSLWHAELHEPFLHLSHFHLLRYRGGERSWLAHRPPPAPATEEQRAKVSGLPLAFDWRNVGGVNFLSPVRNQGECGSCYAFSSVGMLEARIRVRTNNTQMPSLAPQDVVSCSPLSQGCGGGFPFLVAGRYGKDYGFPPEQCNPYQGHDGPCSRDTCPRQYTARYSYVGGYYGACNEYMMQLALVVGGPLSVSFEVHSDFMQYKGGIYHFTGVELPGFNPFVLVNHAVLLVGWGEDEQGNKYWTVKNSWGNSWGENGYFRILRGSNECGIESIAAAADPIP